MNKKDKVREYLELMKDKQQFNLISVAAALRVDTKDVSNVVQELKANGVVTGEVMPGSKYMTYTVVGNIKAAIRLKQDPAPSIKPPYIPPAMRNIKPEFDDRLHKTVRKAPAKRRSPFVMAIDAEIKSLELKVKNLRQVRKEFE